MDGVTGSLPEPARDGEIQPLDNAWEAHVHPGAGAAESLVEQVLSAPSEGWASLRQTPWLPFRLQAGGEEPGLGASAADCVTCFLPSAWHLTAAVWAMHPQHAIWVNRTAWGLGPEAHTCNPALREAEAGGPQVKPSLDTLPTWRDPVSR